MSEHDPLGIVGQTVYEKYVIDELIGVGGYAVVYRATHAIWRKPVAIKLFSGLSSAPPELRNQLRDDFVQEGALLTELSSHSAQIVQARDVGTYTTPDGQWMPFMVLEWLDGVPLEDLLQEQRAQGKTQWKLAETVELLGSVARALDVAHARGIAHRDVKPSNLMMLRDQSAAGTFAVKILDFGVAKLMADNTQMKAALAKTGMNITAFTPQYGAPEQFSRSYGATGPWTDVFALALIGVELLVGRPGLDGNDFAQLGYSACNREIRPTPRALGALVPDAVEQVFQKALALDPGERYVRAAEFWTALNQATRVSTDDTVLVPSSPSSVSPAPSATRRSRVGWLLGVAGVLGVGVLGGVVWMRSSRLRADLPAVTATPALPSDSASAAAPAPACPEGMTRIPGGQFFMGSDQPDALPNEKPTHQVKLDAFCIDLFEVTVSAYKACSDTGMCRRASRTVDWPGITEREREIYRSLCNEGAPDKAQHPINCVNWQMASEYCLSRSARLPTEAEWEYATRGPDGRIYPWGDEPPTARHLNACGTECAAWGATRGETLPTLYDEDDGFAATSPVGKFPAGRSRFGPYDVAGNVWEWVADWYGEYSVDRATNPTGPKEGEKRVVRGGAWNGSYATWLRPSFRYGQDPAALSHGIGLRCARSLVP